MKPRNPTHAMLQKIERWPMGLSIFSKLICFKAPYFGSIKPRFTSLRPGYAQAVLKKRRRVQNHLKTVHAIAMANLCEFVGGTLMEISVAKNMRWIPKGMNIQYLTKAATNLIATAEISDYDWQSSQDVIVTVNVHDLNGQLMSQAKIPMYVSPKK